MPERWTQDWPFPPTSLVQLELWVLYVAVWEQAQLTPAGVHVNSWLKRGLPDETNDPDGFYQLALDRFLYASPTRRHS